MSMSATINCSSVENRSVRRSIRPLSTIRPLPPNTRSVEEIGILAAHPDRGQADLFARHEAAGLVKFRVIGNICLGDHAVNTSLSENYRAVVEGVAIGDGHTDDGDDGQFAGLGEDIAQGLFRRMEQGGLLDQIAAGIGGDAEFRDWLLYTSPSPRDS